MVCHRQIVIDGFRDPHEFLRLIVNLCIVREHLDRVHGIVPAVIQEILDVVFLQNREKFLIDCFISLYLREFISA